MCVFPDTQAIGCDEQMRPKMLGFARRKHIMPKAKQVSNISQLNIEEYNVWPYRDVTSGTVSNSQLQIPHTEL